MDGKLVEPPEQASWYLLYKPSGVVTTLEDPQGRPTIRDFLGEVQTRVFPIGRLDWDAEGALLLTDDGAAAHRLLHPSFQVPRSYLTKVKGTPTEEGLARLVSGVRLEDGPARALEVERFQAAEKNTWLRVTVGEGRPHLVKRLCAAIGHPVVRLFRPHQAGISVAGMQPGELRALRPEEIRTLEAVAGGQPVPPMTLTLPARRHGRAEEEAEADEPSGLRTPRPPKPPRFGTWHAARGQRGESGRAEVYRQPAGRHPPAGEGSPFERGGSKAARSPGRPRRADTRLPVPPGGRGPGAPPGRLRAARPSQNESFRPPPQGGRGLARKPTYGASHGRRRTGVGPGGEQPAFGRPRRGEGNSAGSPREERGFPGRPQKKGFGAQGGRPPGRPAYGRAPRADTAPGRPARPGRSFPGQPGSRGFGPARGQPPRRPAFGQALRGESGSGRPPGKGPSFPGRPGGRGSSGGGGRPLSRPAFGRPPRGDAAPSRGPRDGRRFPPRPGGGGFASRASAHQERPGFERGGDVRREHTRPAGRGRSAAARSGKPFGKHPAKSGPKGWQKGPPERGHRGPPRPGGGPRRPTR
jgi:23S rRNA pseudouridine2605 synthase